MNPGQQKFKSFILERVKEGEQDKAEVLLSESFQKLDERSFDQSYLKSFMPRMKSLLKPEHVEEVEAIMKEFGAKFSG
ncbi:hypothetical protein MHB50_06330 [Siminovitchia sp. FSL H7-0308]|uniref:Uncharacterized protein n=1 Tax=Siminovitchia thermophila TaxID=1245522 RepID=A0ABS2RBP7_9BACI|nr:hypothetical protein [Siminovitchia thermophila]MBM7716248.1 hypothetical protein [Siminovitchia thermophila]ONK21064.1 hypothetical protein BLX87_23410 [Bacillus sp. VT-16-64]